jgi:very-short-patch-repair endonuclease
MRPRQDDFAPSERKRQCIAALKKSPHRKLTNVDDRTVGRIMHNSYPATSGRIDADDVIMDLASRQHGVVARNQLVRAGVPADVLDRRVKKKRLRTVHRGVYLVGPVVAPHAREMAALLACGGAGVLSHRTASFHWHLQTYPKRPDAVELSAAGGNRPRVPGVRVYRVRELPADEVTVLDGMPITTVARTLCDLAGVAEQRELEHAFAEALGRGLTDRAELLAAAARGWRRRGVRRLRKLIENEEQQAPTRSNAEKRFLELIRRAQLPKPEVNASVGGYRVDFLWGPERFVVEIDGFAFHSSSRKFEGDRRRDAELAAAGVRVVRVTWRQLVREPEAVAVRLGQALARTEGT